MTLVIALMSLVLLSSLATSLVIVTNTEQRAAANYAASRATMYAAEGALQIAARELLLVGDWNALLRSGALSSFVDGAPGTVRQLGDGSTLDLVEATALANGEARPWGPNNPVWRLFAFGSLGRGTYVVAWAADDPAETDGDPFTDGGGVGNPGTGVLAVRAEAFGVGGAHKVLEATVRRHVDTDGVLVLQMMSWQEIR
jgi:hypothetical protein